MPSDPRKPNPAWKVVLLGLGLLGLLAAWRSAGRMMQMKADAVGNAQFTALNPGQSVKVVLEVVSQTPERKLTGRLLEEKDQTHYTRSPTEIEATFDSKTPIMMGKASDLQPGAIVHVTGTVAEDRSLRATRLVVLTGYVEVSDR